MATCWPAASSCKKAGRSPPPQSLSQPHALYCACGVQLGGQLLAEHCVALRPVADPDATNLLRAPERAEGAGRGGGVKGGERCVCVKGGDVKAGGCQVKVEPAADPDPYCVDPYTHRGLCGDREISNSGIYHPHPKTRPSPQAPRSPPPLPCRLPHPECAPPTGDQQHPCSPLSPVSPLYLGSSSLPASRSMNRSRRAGSNDRQRSPACLKLFSLTMTCSR